MRNQRILGMILCAMILALGGVFTACGDDDEDGTSFETARQLTEDGWEKFTLEGISPNTSSGVSASSAPESSSGSDSSKSSSDTSPKGKAVWFYFTPEIGGQFIHFKFNALQSLQMQAYDANKGKVGNGALLHGVTGGYASTYLTLAVGQSYYVEVKPLPGDIGGDAEITYSRSVAPPDNLPWLADEGVWYPLTTGGDQPSLADGGGVQWFRFIARSGEQEILFDFGSPTPEPQPPKVQVYNATGGAIGSDTPITGLASAKGPLTLTVGETYYIRVEKVGTVTTADKYRIKFDVAP